MALSTQPYKGARDFYPEDKRVQKHVFNVLRRVVESFGYQEYDAPIIEPIELYLSKTSEEIVVEQTFVFTDRGGRTVTLRPEMTPTVSRMVAAKRQELAYPLRWYSIPNLWRYERPQAGRLREHWQLNVDIFGVAGIEADHEIILIADKILKAFDAKPENYTIKVNSRQLLNWFFLDSFRLDHSQIQPLARLIDKKDKLAEKEFKDAAQAILSPAQQEAGVLSQLEELLKVKTLGELPLVVQQHPAAKQLQHLMTLLMASGVQSAIFDPSLMRGFDYYTDIVFEVFDNNPDNNRSMFGGGRYDGLVSAFGVEAVPTVGFGMGDVTLQAFLEGHKLLPSFEPETDATAILIGDVYEAAQKTLAMLRQEGLRLAVDSTGRKVDTQIKSAAKAGIPYVIFIGEHELDSQRFKLKDLRSGEEKELSMERMVSTLAARHRQHEADDLE
ncbi:MAG TPA: histidine--tRNA ligase [Candidatus Saccharimonadales bacterium]|nr:histidine--tRNA ligase [Candidatus Saccharimonadales bacterium]